MSPRLPRAGSGRILAAAAAMLMLCTCGSATAGGKGPSSRSVTLSERNNGGIVTVARGTPLVLRLHRTYWRIRGSSNPAVVRQTGPQQTRAVLPPRCLPGMGCGTASAPFEALHAGRARLSATRTICGEALRCSPAQRRYAVVILVR